MIKKNDFKLSRNILFLESGNGELNVYIQRSNRKHKTETNTIKKKKSHFSVILPRCGINDKISAEER